MYITFDYKCLCGHVDTRMVQRDEMDDQYHDPCPEASAITGAPCPMAMTRLPAGTRTTFRFADTKLKD